MSYTNKGVDLSKYEKYGKKKEVELSSERVELSIVDDFKKVFEKALDENERIGKTLIDALSKAEGKYKSIISDYQKALKIGEKAQSSAKELGVELPVAFNNSIKNCIVGIKESQTLIGKINQLYRAF